MNEDAKLKFAACLGGLFLMAGPALVLAAAPPDAGTVLDTVRGEPVLPSRPASGVEVQQESRPAMKPAGGMRVKVSAFKVSGMTAFSEAELQALVADSVGKEQGFDDLENAAVKISRFYRSHGYLVARAYIPAQEIKGGLVEIAVLEGRIGKVAVKMMGEGRLAESAVQATVAASAKPGDAIREDQIERGLLLANDLPGLDVKSTLIPGASVGTSDLVVEATQAGPTSGSIDADNFGNRYTGIPRVGGSFNFNSPAGIGDQLTFRGLTSGRGLNYGRIAYIVPVGVAGTKLGAAYSALKYKLGSDFQSLDAKGEAHVASLFAVHPIVRSRNLNLYGQAGFDHKYLFNEASGSAVSNKDIDTLTLGLSGDSRDGLGYGGLNSFTASYVRGNLNLGRLAADEALDAASTKASGGYEKFVYNLARLQQLNESLSLSVALSGQISSKNLDSAEKFVLGGPAGVRAYPQGEAAADEGYMLNAELRLNLPVASSGVWQFVGFFDAGRARLHKSTWNGWQGSNPNLPNDYSLYGLGMGINFTKPGDYMVRTSVARKVGGNPGRDTNNNDINNSNDSHRLWLQLVKWY